ncbi:MAG: hypothetical protein KKD38_00280 [Candidatus Delongbacteria bacterium]|nr:hypothetical protein [Candidatus Delongbacteria bacterium]MCG2760578.1 hypothetical protein [Candidatus Delongbacteria bacterium]
MKNENKERIPRIKIVTIGKEFDSVVKRYLNESVKRNSADVAQVIMNGRVANVKYEENDRLTDMLIVCCGQVSGKKRLMIDEMLKRASKYGSPSFTSVLIATGSVKDEDFINADMIIHFDETDETEVKVVRCLQLLVEISTKYGMGPVDFGDLKALFELNSTGSFVCAESKYSKGEIENTVKKVFHATALSEQDNSVKGFIMLFAIPDVKEIYTELGMGLGSAEIFMNDGCKMLFNTVTSYGDNIEFSLLVLY